MKIGVLAYHAACNYGAFLQLLSTVEYIKRRGDDPRVINWVPKDFLEEYERCSPLKVRQLYSEMQSKYYPLTRICHTPKDVAEIIEEEGIRAVIIGSDAVLQHHPFRERFHFPVRCIVYISHPTSDRMFPNCFWGNFIEYLKNPVPLAVISGSSQDSKYFYIKGRTKRDMNKAIHQFSYISVRDAWTQKMISYLTDDDVAAQITPDPVFAFNYNAGYLVPSKEEILNKFSIPDNYLLMSFKGPKSVNQTWISSFISLASEEGLACVKLPYPDSQAFGSFSYTIEQVTPLEWYSLIKYSRGYIGNNMHPIVTAIHNGVPFYSFDNYGISHKDGHPTNGESSKIYHILEKSGLLQYRVFVGGVNYSRLKPTPQNVLDLITSFDVIKEKQFAESYYMDYLKMMNDVYSSLF